MRIRVHQYIGWFVDEQRFETLEEALACCGRMGGALKARLFVDRVNGETQETAHFDLDATAIAIEYTHPSDACLSDQVNAAVWADSRRQDDEVA